MEERGKWERKMIKCSHGNGWVCRDEFCFFDKGDNDDIEVEAECNNCDCREKRRFKFDIENVKEVKDV